MIEWLTNLPKLIDAFISGVIEFCYRFLGGVLQVSRRPTEGVRALEANEEQLSSRTMLFGASALFLLFSFINVTNVEALSGAGAGRFLLMAIVVYVAADSLASAGARYCAARSPEEPVDKLRDYLRYAMAASLILFALALMVLPALAALMPNPANITPQSTSMAQMAGLLALSALLFVVVIFGLVICFYHPMAVIAQIAGWKSGLGRKLRILLGSAVLSAVFGTVVFTAFSLLNKLDGPIFITPVGCIASADGVEIALVAENASASATYITRRSLKLRLAYALRAGEEPLNAISGGYEEFALSAIKDDVALIEPRANISLHAQARPDSPAYRQFVADGRPGACQLVKGRSRRKISDSDAEIMDVAAAAPAAAK